MAHRPKTWLESTATFAAAGTLQSVFTVLPNASTAQRIRLYFRYTHAARREFSKEKAAEGA
jgi:hypothetical protein